MALHLRQGAPALLFDRLVARDVAGVARVITVHDDIASLQGSIAEQLGWLLNTRAPADLPTLESRLHVGTRSTIDYGLPDLSAFPLGEANAMARLNDHVVRTIAVYEPRLREPRVAIAPADGRSTTLVADITGAVAFGQSLVPVAFTVPIGGDRIADVG